MCHWRSRGSLSVDAFQQVLSSVLRLLPLHAEFWGTCCVDAGASLWHVVLLCRRPQPCVDTLFLPSALFADVDWDRSAFSVTRVPCFALSAFNQRALQWCCQGGTIFGQEPSPPSFFRVLRDSVDLCYMCLHRPYLARVKLVLVDDEDDE